MLDLPLWMHVRAGYPPSAREVREPPRPRPWPLLSDFGESPRRLAHVKRAATTLQLMLWKNASMYSAFFNP